MLRNKRIRTVKGTLEGTCERALWPNLEPLEHKNKVEWQPTPVFLPGESQGRGSLVAADYGVTQSRTRLK